MIGAGLIGRAWAMVFARAGWQRAALRQRCRAARRGARAHRRRASPSSRRTVSPTMPQRPLARIDYVDGSRQTPWPACDWVQENPPEVLDVKRELYPRIDRATPATADLASSTSAIPGVAVHRRLAGRARCLVAHPVNPPHLVPVVELCGAPWTDAGDDRARARGDDRRSARCRSPCSASSTASS